MERETKKVKLPKSQSEVEIKTYLTGREAREISGVYLKEAEVGINLETGKPEMKSINAELANEAQNKAIEILVVSLAGKNEKLLDSILDLRQEDFDFLIGELDSIQNTDKKKEAT